MGRAFLVPLIALASVALGACTVTRTEIPGLAGPSELALSLFVIATPDNIVQDGFSQSTIVILARDANGQAIPNLQLKLNVQLAGSSATFGSLSQSTLYTGSDGRASAVYTAPPALPFQGGTSGQTVTIAATPVGSNYVNATSQSASVRVAPPAAPPAVPGAPTASVTYTPAAPKAGEIVRFDASTSQAAPGHGIVTYSWDFGDSIANDEHGSDGSHTYSSAGTYTLVLVVVDELGRVGSSIKTIVVSN